MHFISRQFKTLKIYLTLNQLCVFSFQIVSQLLSVSLCCLQKALVAKPFQVTVLSLFSFLPHFKTKNSSNSSML